MAKSTPVPVTDVPQNTREFLDQVLTDGRVLAVEVDDGRVAIVAPEWTGRTPRRRTTQGRAPRATPPECIEAALATAGAFADLDWDEALDELERMDKEVPPTPVIDEL